MSGCRRGARNPFHRGLSGCMRCNSVHLAAERLRWRPGSVLSPTSPAVSDFPTIRCTWRVSSAVVSERGLEPPRGITPLGPQPSASANSATPTWGRGVYVGSGPSLDDLLDLRKVTYNSAVWFYFAHLESVVGPFRKLDLRAPGVESTPGRWIDQ